MLVICLVIGLLSGCKKAEVKNGFETKGNGHNDWFLVTPSELIKTINQKAAEKGYSELSVLKTSKGAGTTSTMYTFNGDYWLMIFASRDDNGYIQMVTLDTYISNDDKDKAERIGVYAEILFDIFSPSGGKEIAKNIYFYDHNPPKDKFLQYDYGNTRYFYNYHSTDLVIQPVPIIIKEDTIKNTPTKPKN